MASTLKISDPKSEIPNPSGRRVRFGLVGCGRVGATADASVRRWAIASRWLPFSHASAIGAVPEAELVAVCDVDESAATRAMEQHHAAAWYVDYREMLARERLDAIAIATRTACRKPILEDAVQAGIKGIYCEKPLSNTLEDADALARAIEDAGVLFVYGAQRRYMPTYQAGRQLVQDGVIGKLTTIIVRFGYGLLFWNHPHSVDIASFFAGDAPIESVQADLGLDASTVTGGYVDADPTVRMACVRFVNDVTAHIVASESFDVELAGTKGVVAVRSDGDGVRWRRRASDQDEGWLLAEEIVPVHDGASGTVNSIKALTRAVLDGEPPPYGIRLAVRNQEALFGFVYSHLQDGARINFPLERRQMTITGRHRDLYA